MSERRRKPTSRSKDKAAVPPRRPSPVTPPPRRPNGRPRRNGRNGGSTPQTPAPATAAPISRMMAPAALSGPARQVIKVRRTADLSPGPPEGLEEGELALEMNSPARLWVGVPTALEASGRKLLLNSTFGEAPTDGFVYARRGSDATWQGLTRTGNNTTIGEAALAANTSGTDNLALGVNALTANISGSSNVFVGNWSGWSQTTGSFNTAIGVDALNSNQAGSNNVAIGWVAGSWFGGTGGTSLRRTDNSIYIGFESRSLTDNVTNQIVIGHNTIGRGSNTATLGNDAITALYCRGMLELGTPTGPAVSGQGHVNISGRYHINGEPVIAPPAWTELTAPFTEPLVGATVTAEVRNTEWMAVGAPVRIDEATYTVFAVISDTFVTLQRIA